MKKLWLNKVINFKTIFDVSSLLSAHVSISLIFLALAIIFILTGNTPSHDSIVWHGGWHYFCSSIVENGVLSFWNPYSQTGTPFFVDYQSFGLLEPSNFLFIFIQKITGCTTLTAYLLHLLFYYFIFIIGTYNTLRIITKSNKISLLFSMILLLACFPIFMRQIGALNSFFLIPFITFFLLLFFGEVSINKKGSYLFVIISLCAISSLIHIPTGTVFYVLLFCVFAFILKIANIREIFQFIASKYGLFWISASIIIMILISSPVLALYSEFHNSNEIFTSVRAQIVTSYHLVKCFVSDLGTSILLEKYTIKHSITLGNLVGLILEPYPFIPKIRLQASEIVLYISILPFLCVFVIITRIKEIKDKYTHLFLILAGFTLLIMCNFKSQIVDPPSLFQNVISFIVPTLNKSEVLQNFGSLFLFCIVIISAVGFKRILDNGSKTVWLAALSILSFRYIIFFPVTLFRPLLGKLAVPTTGIIIIYVLSAVFLGVFLGKPIINRLKRISIEKFRTISIILLFMDLLFFNMYHVKARRVIGKHYYNTLKNGNILETRLEDSFINYRVPFSYPKDYFSHFYGHGILNAEKAAFPIMVRSHLNESINEDYYDFIGKFDHIFTTTHYYDYLVNVELDKQLATSSVIYPILNFFPLENTIFVENKYEVVKRINQLNIENLGKYIFIEKNEKDFSTPSFSLDSSYFFDPKNYLEYSQKELINFERNKSLKYLGNNDVNFNIKHYDVNTLSIIIETPEDGYFYFGDGYSKHWKAFLDDQEVKIEKTNVNFKSVYVPKGKHSLVFIYDPVYFRYSVYASFIGSLIAIAFFLLCLSPLKISFFQKSHT